VRSVQGPP